MSRTRKIQPICPLASYLLLSGRIPGDKLPSSQILFSP
jgi:hypothetical protein